MDLRKIILRAKTLNEGEWVYGDLEYSRYNDTARIHVYDEDGLYDRQEKVNRDTVGQYTGVDDKYGKRIFEGDIVRIHEDIGFDNVGVVVFKDGCFGVEYYSYRTIFFHPLYKTKDEWKDMNATIPVNITFEVLGNIFDDSQILAN